MDQNELDPRIEATLGLFEVLNTDGHHFENAPAVSRWPKDRFDRCVSLGKVKHFQGAMGPGATPFARN